MFNSSRCECEFSSNKAMLINCWTFIFIEIWCIGKDETSCGENLLVCVFNVWCYTCVTTLLINTIVFILICMIMLCNVVYYTVPSLVFYLQHDHLFTHVIKNFLIFLSQTLLLAFWVFCQFSVLSFWFDCVYKPAVHFLDRSANNVGRDYLYRKWATNTVSNKIRLERLH